MVNYEGKSVKHTSWQRMKRNTNIDPVDFLCELIDNSIQAYHDNDDKNHLEINIKFPALRKSEKIEENWFYYNDNILGIKDNEEYLFGELGVLNYYTSNQYNKDLSKRKHSKSKYGVGIKDFMFYLGKKIIIKTIKDKSTSQFWQIKELTQDQNASSSLWTKVNEKTILKNWGNIVNEAMKSKFFLCIDMHADRRSNINYSFKGLNSEGEYLGTKDDQKIYEKWLHTLLFKYYKEISKYKIKIIVHTVDNTKLIIDINKIKNFWNNNLFINTKNVDDQNQEETIEKFRETIPNSDFNHNLIFIDKYKTLLEMLETSITHGQVEFFTKFNGSNYSSAITLKHKITALKKSSGLMGGVHIYQNSRALISYPKPFNVKNENFKWLWYPTISLLPDFKQSTGSGAMTGWIYWEVELIDYDERIFEPTTNKTGLNERAEELLGEHMQSVFEKDKLKYLFGILTYLAKNLKDNKVDNTKSQDKKTNNKNAFSSKMIEKQQDKINFIYKNEKISYSAFIKNEQISFYIVNNTYVRFQKLQPGTGNTDLILKSYAKDDQNTLYENNEEYTNIIKTLEKYIKDKKVVEKPHILKYEGIVLNNQSPIFKGQDIKNADKLLILAILSQIISKSENSDSILIINHINRAFN